MLDAIHRDTRSLFALEMSEISSNLEHIRFKKQDHENYKER